MGYLHFIVLVCFLLLQVSPILRYVSKHYLIIILYIYLKWKCSQNVENKYKMQKTSKQKHTKFTEQRNTIWKTFLANCMSFVRLLLVLFSSPYTKQREKPYNTRIKAIPGKLKVNHGRNWTNAKEKQKKIAAKHFRELE